MEECEPINIDIPMLLQCGDVLTDVFGFLLPQQQHALRATCRQATLWFDTAADTYHMIPMFVSGHGVRTRDLLNLDDDATMLDAIDLDEGVVHPGAAEGATFDPRFETVPKDEEHTNESSENVPRSWRYAPVQLYQESIPMPNPRPALIHTLCRTRIGTLFVNLRCLDARLHEFLNLRCKNDPNSIMRYLPNILKPRPENNTAELTLKQRLLGKREEKGNSTNNVADFVTTDTLVSFTTTCGTKSEEQDSLDQNDVTFIPYNERFGRKLRLQPSFLQGLNASSVVFVEPQRLSSIAERYLADSSITVAVFDGMRNLEKISHSFLRDCYNLRFVNFGGLGERLETTIPNFTLSGCTRLRRVVFPTEYVHRDILRRDDVYLNADEDVPTTDADEAQKPTPQSLFAQVVAVGDSVLERCGSLVSVELNGLCKVATIGSGFLSFAGLKTFVVPPNFSNVRIIGDRFMMHCARLESANFDNFSSSLTTVGACWLANAENLTSVSFRGLIKLSKVGGLWMGRCPKLGPLLDLTELYQLDTVGPRWLCETPSLRRIIWPHHSIDKDNGNMVSSDSAKSNQPYPSRSVHKADSSAYHMTSIGDYWLHASGIEELLIEPPHRFFLLKSIGSESLTKCPNLKKVVIECCPYLESIGSGFLADCPSLETVSFVTLPRLKTIGDDWLSGAVALRQLTFRPNLLLVRQNFKHAGWISNYSKTSSIIELGQGWLQNAGAQNSVAAKSSSGGFSLKKLANSCASDTTSSKNAEVPGNKNGCRILSGYTFYLSTRYGNSLAVSIIPASGFVKETEESFSVDSTDKNNKDFSFANSSQFEGQSDKAVFHTRVSWEPPNGLAAAVQAAHNEATQEENEKLKAKEARKTKPNTSSTSSKADQKDKASGSPAETPKERKCAVM